MAILNGTQEAGVGSGWVFTSFDRARWDAIFGSRAPEVKQKIVDAMLWDNDGYFDDDSDELRPGYNRDKILASAEGKAAQELASHLVIKGFTYDGLSTAQSVQLDEFGSYMWAPEPEGLQAALDAKKLSESWLPPSVVPELLFRAGHRRSLRYLERLPVMGESVVGFVRLFVFYFKHMRELRRPPHLPRTPVRLLRLLETGRRFGTEAEPTRGDSCYYVVFSLAELVELRREVEASVKAPIPWTEPEWMPEDTEQNLLIPLNETIKAGRWGGMKYAF